VAPQPLDELRAPDHDPGLRTAEELVAREADEVRACLEALANRGLVLDLRQRARTEVVDQRQLVALRDFGQVRDRR
jgi:hypothetical protein